MIVDELGEFVARTRHPDLPGDVIDAVKLRILDRVLDLERLADVGELAACLASGGAAASRKAVLARHDAKR